MRAIGKDPKTPEDYLRRSLALVLDEAFTKGAHPKDHRLLLPDFDVLVERLALAAERHAARITK